MLDFIDLNVEEKKDTFIIGPDFMAKYKSTDLMIKGRSFYAIWDDNRKVWTTDEYDAIRLIDQDVVERTHEEFGGCDKRIQYRKMQNFSSKKLEEWNKFCKAIGDNYTTLDSKIIFSNQESKKEECCTRKLPYPLTKQKIDAYDELMSALYAPEEREKIEWAIGAIISGDSKWIQKFLVFYGGPGTGKSTVLNIIEDMFRDYCSSFDAKALTSNDAFALESLRENKLIAIQHDGDLSRIEDNATINSVVSHETVVINEKHKSKYSLKFHTFLMLGTNKPVRITDAKSGILRRLIDVSPTGNLIPVERYRELTDQIKFEYSGIAWHCLKEVYEKLGPNYYKDYVAESMISYTNDFYNFILDNYDLFKDIKGEKFLELNTAWMRYKHYADMSDLKYPMPMRVFRHELMNYFKDFKKRHGQHYSVYFDFIDDKFESHFGETAKTLGEGHKSWLRLLDSESGCILDEELSDCYAQYATADEKPIQKWEEVVTRLKDLDTSKTHYVRCPDNLIVIDFDLKDESGGKSYERNLEAASSWPITYAEVSKGGSGIHLHYWYTGEPSELSRIFADDIEIKVFTGKSSLRRKVTKCNDVPIATISSGLPLRERRSGKMLEETTLKSERSLRQLIKRNLRKEIHPGTKPSIDFIYKILEDAYESGLNYDVTDMRHEIQHFALNSSHQADYCLKMVSKMKFKSEEPSEDSDHYEEEAPIVFFDVEVFPNLFVVVWKKVGEENRKVTMINPTPSEIKDLINYRLAGFNNRKYDNHILYGRMMGYTNEQLFRLSKRIIDNEKDACFGEAYNLSYTDIYDYSSEKMSLKKWEIKLGLHHDELGLPWDQPVPEELWSRVGEYCGYDVEATEAVWFATEADFLAREILAEWAEMTVNDTTNNLTTRLIVGKDRNPQSKFIYTDLSTIFPGYEYDPYGIDPKRYLPGVKIVQGKSIYLGKDPSEGGYAIGYPGMYTDVAVLDVASMHPHSAIKLKVFGEEYTLNFDKIVKARILIKHKDYEAAKQMLPERLHKYLDDPKKAKRLAYALKIAINSVYGLTSAKFPNKLKDPRNVDNIVAKYGALFMMTLEEEVKKRWGNVVHIKTDSIKLSNATPEMIRFVMEFGKKYGYTFEHEATYSKMCIVNDAVYIAKYASAKRCRELYGYVPGDNEEKGGKWTATGKQFQVPYVFKTLFSKEPIEFPDLCETNSVTTEMHLDCNEGYPDVSMWEDLKDARSLAERKGFEELTRKQQNIVNEYQLITDDEVKSEIAKGHNRHFVGKVGQFCPVIEGSGGGVLERYGEDGKYSAVAGTKRPSGGVYRWLETEVVKSLGLEDRIDRSYYNDLVDKAVEELSKYCDLEAFTAEDSDESWMDIPEGVEGEEYPFPMNPPVGEVA